MAYPLLLHSKHHDTGVTYEVLGDWVVPWRFGSFAAEYHTLHDGVGLIDYSTQALIEVQGADRVSFLHSLLTNDIKRLTPGTGCRAALLNPNATLIADCLVMADPSSLWLLCDANRAAIVTQALERHLFSEQVTLVNHERAYAVLALQGPAAMEVVKPLFGSAVSLPHPGDHVTVPLHHTTLRMIHHRLTTAPGILCVIPADEALMVWKFFTQRGQPLGLRRVGWEALNAARIEAGTPWFGIDMDESNLLPETGLEAVAVSDSKGCYLGQEIIARMQTYGSANKKLMGLLLGGDQVPSAGDRMVRDGDEVGWVTSACHSPALDRPIGMGYVKRGSYEPGTTVEILRGDHRLPATVVVRPLVKPIVHSQ